MDGANLAHQEQPQRENPREKRNWWARWIKAARDNEHAKAHRLDAKEAWDEYENAKPGMAILTDPNLQLRTHPIYWASCKQIESAFYAGVPKTDTRRLWDIEDPVALTASLICERLGDHLIEESDFDTLIPKAIGDFIHADKATTQILFQAGETTDQGRQQPSYPRVYAAPILYDEIIHTPSAKTTDEITEMAAFFKLSRDEAEARFPEATNIQWKTGCDSKTGEEKDNARDETPGEYLEGWECWSKVTKRVYWFSEQYSEGLLDAKDDLYHLRNFFPFPKFIINSNPAKHLYPTPAYQQCKAIIMQMHELVRKSFKLIKAIRRRALVDSSDPNLIAALNSLDDTEYIGCEGIRSLVEKGGLDSMIWFIPVQELVAHLGELSELEAKFKEQFYEWFGIPDVLRGTSDPRETARATGIKQASAFGRFEMPILQVAKLVSDTIEMMIDLALSTYPDEQIMQIVGFEFMSDEHRQNFPDALAMLRRDDMRVVRVEISTDQLSTWSRQLKQQRKNAISEVITNGLGSIAQIAQNNPEFVNVSLQILLQTLEQMEGGKEFSQEVKGAVDALMQKLNAPPPEEPPPPDYEMMKLEIESRKVDVAQMRAQMDNLAKERDLERREYEVNIKDRDSQVSEQMKTIEAQLSHRIQGFTEFLQQQQLQLEQYKTALVEREKLIEEQRLSLDAQTEQIRLTMPSQEQPIPQPQIIQMPPMEMPPINITIENKKGTQRILRDSLGNIAGVTDEEPAVPLPVLPLAGL